MSSASNTLQPEFRMLDSSDAEKEVPEEQPKNQKSRTQGNEQQSKLSVSCCAGALT